MSHLETPNESNKKRKGDRVELNVGGQAFVSAVSTLTAESDYFRCKFCSEHWGDDEPCFVDQNPVPFGILLDYMRSGLIRVKDITEGVLVQAVFFGMDRLLTAVKVRAYRNLQHSDDSTSEEEALRAFDETYGGMHAAISSGVLPDALTCKPEPKKEYASIKVPDGEALLFEHVTITTSSELETRFTFLNLDPGDPDPRLNLPGSLLGALNKVFSQGYCTYEAGMFQQDRHFATYTFSRKVPTTNQQDESTKIFTDTGVEKGGFSETRMKSLALIIDDTESNSCLWHASENFVGDHESDAKWSSLIRGKDISWLVQRSYAHREEELERLFSNALTELMGELYPDSQEIHRRLRIFSRPL